MSYINIKRKRNIMVCVASKIRKELFYLYGPGLSFKDSNVKDSFTSRSFSNASNILEGNLILDGGCVRQRQRF